MAKIESRAVFIPSLNKTLEQALVDGDIASTIPGDKFKDENFDVAVAASTFTVTVHDFESSNKIDVWVNGQKRRPVTDYTRNDAANTITFAESIPVNSWIEVRIWL